MRKASFFRQLKDRKLVQWALAYFAGAFVVFQLLDALAEPLRLSLGIQRIVLVFVGLGFFVTLVIAWYHGEKGRQRVSGPELLMVASLFVIAGVAITLVKPGEDERVTIPLEGDPRPAVAVFPCENWSPDPADAYFASGIHDEILLQLHKISGLRSVGRESMEWYKANPQPLRDIARELAVGYLGECSVLKDVERNLIRLTFQLLDGATGSQIWAENYEEDLSARGIFEIHSDISRRVAHAVGAAITPEEQARIDWRSTESSAAFNEYLIGRARLRQRTEESFREALLHFENAAFEDSTFALAYVGMADAFSLLASYRYLTAEEGSTHARVWAERALELDSSLGEAHAALGYVQLRFDWDYQAAFRNFERAVELNPNYAEAYQWHAVGLSFFGRTDEALSLIERSLDLDPLNFNIRRSRGMIFADARRFDRAVRDLRQALSLNPGYTWTEAQLGITLVLMGNHDEGISHLAQAAESTRSEPELLLSLSWAYAVSGRESEARRMLAEILESSGQSDLEPVSVARVYTGLGEIDSAFEWLERGYQVRSPNLAAVGNSAIWDLLRVDSRLDNLLARMGLPD